MISRLLRRLFSHHATGGEIRAYRPRPGDRLVLLNPGRRIDDPDGAEALGLTADTRRMRQGGRP